MIVINSLNRLNIISKSSGGSTLQSNLVGACEACNKSKGTTYWKIWYKEKSFYNESSEKYICDKLKTNKRL